MIKIIDYGLGNVKAFCNVYERLKIPVSIANNSIDLKTATKVILPGVGAFDYAMKKLTDSGMREILDSLVLGKKIPVLGICVGMQILAKNSEEGDLNGLGWIDGSVKRFISSKENDIQLPHMGWNNIQPTTGNLLFSKLDNRSRFYFLHSYFFQCNNAENSICITEYGLNFSSAINNGNIYGVQFHPEKSHQWGIQLLKNFAEL